MSKELITESISSPLSLSKQLERPNLISRNSQLNLRPQQYVQFQEESINRIRSRSVSRQSSPSVIINNKDCLDISATLIGSPSSTFTYLDESTSLSFENLISGVGEGKPIISKSENSLGKLREGNEGIEEEGNTRGTIEKEANPSENKGVGEGIGSTRFNSKVFNSSKKVERARGFSFTSLLVSGSPVIEKLDPFLSSSSSSSSSPSSYNTDDLSLTQKKSLKDFIPQLLILLSLFLSSFLLIAFLITTLPSLFIPHSINDLPALTTSLAEYRKSSLKAEIHLFFILSLLYCWKQTFAIPGSLLSNILFGALYGVPLGSLMACFWTAVGSTGSYYISMIIAPLIEYYFATPLLATRRALNLPSSSTTSSSSSPAPTTSASASSSDLFSHLLLARFFPLIPYSILNVICGILKLPIGIFFSTLLVGSFPFNFVTVSIGDVIALAASGNGSRGGGGGGERGEMIIWSREVLIKLVLVTLGSILPLLFKKRIQSFVGSQEVKNLFTTNFVGGGGGVGGNGGNGIKDWIGRKKIGLGILRIKGFNSTISGSASIARNGLIASDRRRKNRSWLGDLAYSALHTREEGSSLGGGGGGGGGEESPILG